MTAPSSGSYTSDVAILYAEHHPWLLSWLRRKLGCPHHAADLTHDTFVRVLGALDNGLLANAQTMREPRAYLTTTASRLVTDAARRREIERAYLETLVIVQPHESEMPSPEHMVQLFQTLHRIALMLEGLPTKVRQAFLMFRLEEQPQDQIARELGVSTSMVKKYVAQAMVHCYAAAHGVPAA